MIEGHNLLASPTRTSPFAFLLDGANRPVDSLSLEDIDKRNTRDLHATLAGRRLVVDARCGGLTEGLLDGDADGQVPTIENNWDEPDDDPHLHAWTLRVDVRSDSEQAVDGWQSVLAAPYGETPEGDTVFWLIVSKRHDAGESEDARAVARKAQSLDEHRQWAGEEAARIADALGLGVTDKAMLISAARHHDDGKAASRWQRAFGAMRQTVSSCRAVCRHGSSCRRGPSSSADQAGCGRAPESAISHRPTAPRHGPAGRHRGLRCS